jgi:hypothetical protein
MLLFAQNRMGNNQHSSEKGQALKMSLIALASPRVSRASVDPYNAPAMGGCRCREVPGERGFMYVHVHT